MIGVLFVCLFVFLLICLFVFVLLLFKFLFFLILVVLFCWRCCSHLLGFFNVFRLLLSLLLLFVFFCFFCCCCFVLFWGFLGGGGDVGVLLWVFRIFDVVLFGRSVLFLLLLYTNRERNIFLFIISKSTKTRFDN